MAEFGRAINTVLQNEGGYVHDPADAGGETKFGISKRSFPDVDIKGLSPTTAADIYQRTFWNTHPQLARLDSQAVATKTFDLMVNMGSSRGIKILQSSINRVAGEGGTVHVDGRLGPMTVDRANAVDERSLLAAMREAAADYYRAIAKAKPSQAKFLRGWLRRAYE